MKFSVYISKNKDILYYKYLIKKYMYLKKLSLSIEHLSDIGYFRKDKY